MIFQTQVVGLATITGVTPPLSGTVSISGDGPVGEVAIDGTAYFALQPREPGAVVRYGVEISCGGVFIDPNDIQGPVVVSRSLDAVMQTAEFTVVLRDGDGPFGNMIEYHSPGMGKKEFNIVGVYRLPGGIRRFPLLRRGVVSEVQRLGDPTAGFTEHYAIGDLAATIDRRTVTLIFPAGSNLDRAAIIKLLAQQVGITDFALTNCGAISKGPSLEYVDADLFRAATALLEPKGRVPRFDVNGRLVTPRLAAPTESARWSFTEADVLAGTQVQVALPCDVTTNVTLTTTQQITQDPADVVGLESSTAHSFVESIYQPLQAGYLQSSECALTPLAAPPDSPRFMKISETFDTTETLDGVGIGENSEVWGWFQPEAARFVWAAAGVRGCQGGVYLLSGADPGGAGAEPAFAAENERWQKVTESRSRFYYDDASYLGPGSLSDGTPWGNHFQGNSRGSFTGYELGQVTETYGWGFVGRAIKQKVVGTTWQDTDPITGLLTQGSGAGVTAASSAYGLRTRTVVVIEATAEGLTKRISTFTYGWMAPPRSGDYFYSSGTVSDQTEETFELISEEVVDHQSIGNATRTVTTAINYSQGQVRPVVTYGASSQGAAPAVGRLKNYVPNPDLFQTPQDAAAAKAADPSNTQSIKVNVVAESLEERFYPGIYKTDSPYAETVEELEEQAKLIIDQSAVIRITWAVSLNYDVRDGDPILFTYRPLGIVALKLLAAVITHTIDPENPPSTQIEGRRYPV